MKPETWKKHKAECKLLCDLVKMLGRAVVEPKEAQKKSRLPFLQPEYAFARELFAPTKHDPWTIGAKWGHYRANVQQWRSSTQKVPDTFLQQLKNKTRNGATFAVLDKHYPSVQKKFLLVDSYFAADAWEKDNVLQLRIPFWYAGSTLRLNSLSGLAEKMILIASRRIGIDHENGTNTYRVKVVRLELKPKLNSDRVSKRRFSLQLTEEYLIENGTEWEIGSELLKVRAGFNRRAGRAFVRSLSE